MAMTDFSIVVRSLRTRLFSTITTALTVAVAVALMLVLLMMRASAADAFSRGGGNMHLLISADASPLTSVLNGVFHANAPPRALAYSRYEELAASLPISGNGFAIPTQQGDSFRGLPVVGTTEEFFTKFKPAPGEPWSFTQGQAFQDYFEIVVGAQAANITGLEVGDAIYLTHGIGTSGSAGTIIKKGMPRPDDHHDHAHHDHDHDHDHDAAHEHQDYLFTVSGILAPTGSPHDRAIFSEITSAWILHAHDRRVRENPNASLTDAADLTPADRLVTGIYVGLTTRDDSAAPAVLPQVFDQLRRDPSITVASPGAEMRTLMTMVSNVDQILLAMAGVVILASAIAIMLALYNSMEQRRRQIAILRVLGASQARIFLLIITEATIVGLLGCVTGLAISLGGARLVASTMHERLGLYISPSLPAREVVLLLLATLTLAAVAGLIPATMAYRTSVARNLRPIA